MPIVARDPRRAELRTVCKKWPPLISATELCPVQKMVYKNSCTRESFLGYVSTAMDAHITCQICFELISCILGSGKLTIIVIFKGFKCGTALAHFKSAIFFAETAFEDKIYIRNCSPWSLPMLKCAQKPFVSIASTKWICNARLSSGVTSDTASPVKTGSIIGGYGWEEQ